MEKSSINKQYTLITGASYGIGAAFAREFHKMGHNLIITARNDNKLTELKKELDTKNQSNTVEKFVCDLSNNEACYVLYNFCRENKFQVNVLINNAGVGLIGKHFSFTEEQINNLLRINIFALVTLSDLFGKDMLKFKSGHILNVSSISGYFPIPNFSVYAGTKSFVINFSESLAVELEEYNIKVRCLCPGQVNTNFFKNAGRRDKQDVLSKSADPDFVARYGIYLLYSNRLTGIPGFMNNFLYYLTRFLPTRFVAKMAGRSI